MEGFSSYFLSLIGGNAAVLFPKTAKGLPDAGNYSLLVQEMHKVSEDVNQATRIAEAIQSTTDKLIMDHFDLSAFVHRFDLDPIAYTCLLLAFKSDDGVTLSADGEWPQSFSTS
jgi:CCR4-NOT transcription complex subunit 1